VQPNMKMIQQMQQRLMKAQEELANETVEGTAGGGAVTITMNGHKLVQSVKIDPAAVDPEDVELLQDTIVAAVNEAMRAAQQLANQRLGAIAGGLSGLGIPGL
jgi:nucleoid-associated protein EbfC